MVQHGRRNLIVPFNSTCTFLSIWTAIFPNISNYFLLCNFLKCSNHSPLSFASMVQWWLKFFKRVCLFSIFQGSGFLIAGGTPYPPIAQFCWFPHVMGCPLPYWALPLYVKVCFPLHLSEPLLSLGCPFLQHSIQRSINVLQEN